jgi:hypothetical protein
MRKPRLKSAPAKVDTGCRPVVSGAAWQTPLKGKIPHKAHGPCAGVPCSRRQTCEISLAQQMEIDLIAQCKDRASSAMEMFLRNLSHVPPEKLTWSPTPTAKTALQIAAHVAGYSGGFASVIRAGAFPATPNEFLGPIQARIDSIETVQQAEEMLRKGIADTLDALDSVQPDQIESTLETPIGQTPFLFFMTIPSVHLVLYTGQIDYLQTCWGDLEVYF